ncbi:MAG: hypothetical protein V7707_06320 [Motiliproteus sp.]
MPVGTENLYDEAYKALTRVQKFDTEELPRVSQLGDHLNFEGAVEPAQLLVDLHKRLSLTALEDFPDQVLTVIRDNANSHFNLFKTILDFAVTQGNPSQARDALVAQLVTAYPAAFTALHPYIAYSLHRAADFQRLDSDARATLQSITDKTELFSGQMEKHEVDAQRVLTEIRSVAAEEGVTQQAAHFRAESEMHDTKADEWMDRTIKFAWALGGFAVISLFIHKIPLIAPETTYDTIQLALSKILIFAVISYMLFLSAKNFLSHKHNSIVNKHRQNALMTHKALVEASGDSGIRDAVMVQAASCIFSPQATGYISGDSSGDATNSRSVVEIMTKPLEKVFSEASSPS